MTLILRKNKFFLQEQKPFFYKYNYDIESLLPIQPKSVYQLTLSSWHDQMKHHIVAILNCIYTHIATIHIPGYQLFINKYKIYRELCEYMYSVSTSKYKPKRA